MKKHARKMENYAFIQREVEVNSKQLNCRMMR